MLQSYEKNPDSLERESDLLVQQDLVRPVVLPEGLGLSDERPSRVGNVKQRLELGAAAEPAEGILVLCVVRQPLGGEVLERAQ